MFTYQDQLNRTILLSTTPKRIVSLVPSQTELLFELGLTEEVIGITKFCVHPQQWLKNKTRIGGTKTIKTDLVASLKPDLIIANKEENVKEQIEALEKIAPVWVTDVCNINDAFNMMQGIGGVTGKDKKAQILINTIKNDFAKLGLLLQQHKKIRTAYLIWKDPYMTVGGDTFIHDMLRLCSLQNVFEERGRYPVTTIEELRAKNTELVLLSTEPYPFKQKHIDEITKELTATKILLADGELFSWYGSRMLHVLPYMQNLWHKIGG